MNYQDIVLSWGSSPGGKGRTVINITRITNDGSRIVGDVLATFYDDSGAVSINKMLYSQLGNDEKEHLDRYIELNIRATRYFAENEALLLKEKKRNERTAAKVERVLGFELYEWQKEYIFERKPYSSDIAKTRMSGTTTANALALCLSEGEPLVASLRPARLARNEFLQYLGEDGSTYTRSRCFLHEVKKLYSALKQAGGIELREITF